MSSDDYPGDLAERYGWVNRTVEDAELDTLVDTLARRIASYDKESIAAVKGQINRYTSPSPDDLLSSLELYLKSFEWPGSRRRRDAALAAGRNQAGDYEMRLGYYLGRPAEPTD